MKVICVHKTAFEVIQLENVTSIAYDKTTGILTIYHGTSDSHQFVNPENWLYAIEPIEKTV